MIFQLRDLCLSLLCTLTGRDVPEFKAVNQYLLSCQEAFQDGQLGVKKFVLPLKT